MAYEFGIPVNLDQATRIALGLAGPTWLRKFDVGRSGDSVFVARLSIGLLAEMVVRADRPSKDRFGRMAYTLAALGAIQDSSETEYRIQTEKETIKVSGISCLVANSGSMGMRGITLSPRINISDGLLDIVVVRYVDLGTIAALVTGADPLTNEAFPALQHWQGREITVSAEPEQTVAIDGEPFGTTPCRAEVIPGAVNVIVPSAPPP
jgi:diacylglycerol kinase family enzyme